MKEIEISEPHGLMKDSDGKNCLRFSNWDTEQTHLVPDYVAEVKHLPGPAAFNIPDQALHDDYKDV